MNKINVLYLIPSLSNSGGMERSLLNKVNFLTNTGLFNIKIVTTEMQDCGKSFFYIEESVEVINLKLNFNNFFNSNFFVKVLNTRKLLNRYERSLKEIIQKNSIDICISMGGKELEFLGKMDIPCKKIYECHFEKQFKSKFLELQGKTNLFWKLFGKIRDKQHFLLASYFHIVVVLSDGAFIDWEHLPNKVVKISNPSSIPLKAEINLDISNKRVISIGNLTAVKGYDLLINAWVLIKPNFPDWNLDIFGAGELENELNALINSFSLGDVVRLVGVTRNVEYELENSAFYVMSSRSEGLPMVLIESITCGLPIVAFDCETGPREIINNNDCGILVENGNIERLVEAIENMILDKDLRLKMSKNALVKSKDYELNHIMEEWIHIFQEIIK